MIMWLMFSLDLLLRCFHKWQPLSLFFRALTFLEVDVFSCCPTTHFILSPLTESTEIIERQYRVNCFEIGGCKEESSNNSPRRKSKSGRTFICSYTLKLRKVLINPNCLPGIASATMFDGAKDMTYCDTQLRVAFDGDACLFSDESDHVTKEHVFQHETLFENKPLAQVGSLSSR